MAYGIVVYTNHYVDTSTGQIVDPCGLMPTGPSGAGSAPSQLTTYVELGGARIPFTAEQMKACKTLQYPAGEKGGGEEEEGGGEAGLKVLFFTPATSLGLDLNLAPSTFVFPDDTVVKGSVTLFATVASCMVDRGLIGIGAFSRVRGAMPRLVALFPRLEEPDEEGALEVCGMDLITIPYASEVRDIAALKMGTTEGK